MKIYAIRDRLIDYYMQPFCGPGPSQVKAAFATQVNSGDQSAVSQAPHQFELWQLGEVNETTGQITPTRELICDLSALIRPRRESAKPGDIQIPGLARSLKEPPGRTGESTGDHDRPTAHQAQTADSQGASQPGGPRQATQDG